ncbi:uncharacterized protein ACRADG_009518 isoform 13-T13 [Cochliomyia hominivorax]
MDLTIILAVTFSILVFFLTSIAVFLTRKRNHRNNAPVVVTSATHTAPSGYPVTQMPVGATTTAYQTHAVVTPYPRQDVPAHMQMPMPPSQYPVAGAQPPYPPMPAGNMNPPPYDVAVSGAGAGHQNATAGVYEKQEPYNPNYQM